MMQIGFGVIGLSPQVFWAMTPKEMSMAIIGLSGGDIQTNITRSDFDELLACFPDEERDG